MNRYRATSVLAVPVVVMAAAGLIAGCGAGGSAGSGPPQSRPPAAASAAAAASHGPAVPAAGTSAEPGRSPGGAPGSTCGASPQEPPGAGDRLGGVQFVSGSTGWVAGSDRILGTDDGGRHWRTEYRTTVLAGLSSLDFVDADHGWVVGASTILATADGGGHWHQLPEPCPVLRTVHFVSPVVGFAVAGGGDVAAGAPLTGGILLTTADGGQHWQRLSSTPLNVQSACFTDRGRGTLGAGGRIYVTADGGHTWTLAVGTIRAQPPAAALAQVECAGPGAAWAELIGPGAAMNQQPHVGYHGSGLAWTPIFAEQYFPHPGVSVSANSPGSVAGPFSAVSAADAVFIDLCSACGDGTAPMDLARDGGVALQARGDVRGLTQATAAAFVTLDDGWVVGTHATYRPSSTTASVVNRIVHTTNGGRSWQVQYASG